VAVQPDDHPIAIAQKNLFLVIDLNPVLRPLE
jgi:hypothetical protein